MLLDDIADLLTTAGMSTGSTGISRDYMPPTPDTAIAIYGTGGPGPTYTMTDSVLEEPTLQILCRATSLVTAHTLARGCYKALNGLSARTINGTRYHWAQPSQEPTLFARDENNRFIVSCTYAIKKDRST